FRQATEIDPEYAMAWAGIADSYGQFLQWGDVHDTQELARLGLEAAEKAIALDPKLPHGYKAKALVCKFSGQKESGRRALEQALEVDPRFTPALINLGVEFFTQADLAGAEQCYRKALEVDPQDTFAETWLCFLH